ncbi:MAG: endonuclease MutS2 [Cytophagia bacterium]|nr:MAG: endonuclease MutS2 [Runella sp.]TAG18464.1 MAG: endonuclease MutS2 [Cytophagales bacterium]TAG39036.1 MAG: endonuclease MutS2 [Cytophagia bacterium]TAG51415.1 MAG: endonuclease MutS2 [Runella slithyformis]TAG80552.1 MAG: endonuclease MutS2 [Cytophagales bacterium]
MLYPQDIEQKLGFDRVRELLKEACLSTLGQAFVEKIRFSDNFLVIQKLTCQAAEMKEIIETESEFPSQNYLDARATLESMRIEGMYVSQEAFFDLKVSLRTIRQLLTFFEKQEEGRFVYLRELAQNVRVEKAVTDAIERIIDDRGQIRDNASPELSDIRRRLISEMAGVRKKLDAMLRHAKNSGWVGEEVSLTVRGGRMVIPIVAEHKRKLKGFVHDESATGQTLYIEPADVLDANNEIKELEYAERREINRILIQLANQIRVHLVDLQRAYQFLGMIDFIRAKARLASQLGAHNPVFVNRPELEWRGARHPLLYLSFQKQGRKVVPLSVKLNPDQRILVVSGPNAGGKSVALKTIGLVQYMYQCGLLVPMAEGATMGLFQNLFIDIGDEQSLENDLSTYSSHLTNMKFFLNFANRKTLFLIDEFGTGTEPSLGGAIAESILEDLTKLGASGVVNTHYTNLKTYADKTTGLINGAMRYDGEHLEPLYELEMGKPGSSFAFEIAGKIGLPKAVVERAQSKLGTQQINFEKLLKELDIEKRVFADKNLEISLKERKLAQQLLETNALKTRLDNEQKNILNEAKRKAKQLLADTNQRIESTIREIKENKAEREATKQVRQELEKFERIELKAETVAEPEREEFVTEKGEITVGSYVRIIGQNTVGEVLAIKGKDAEISIGALKSNIKLNRLEKVSKKTYKQATGDNNATATPAPRMGGIDLNEKMMNFSFNLDIRGKRGEEAMIDLDNFMNDALMLSYNQVRIVHGKGDGILRNLVRSHLRSYKQINKLTDEHADRGGAGVTIVELK